MSECKGCGEGCSHPEHRAAVPEPAPTGSGTPVTPVLVELILQRDAMGRAKYGTPLKTRNGRDALVDALQESLDLNQYLMQRVLELQDDLAQATAPRGRCSSCRHATPCGGGFTVDCGEGRGHNVDREWGCGDWAARAASPSPSEPRDGGRPGPFPAGAMKPEWEGDPEHIQTVNATTKQIDAFNLNPGTEWVIYFTDPETGGCAQAFARLDNCPIRSSPESAPASPSEAKETIHAR